MTNPEAKDVKDLTSHGPIALQAPIFANGPDGTGEVMTVIDEGGEFVLVHVENSHEPEKLDVIHMNRTDYLDLLNNQPSPES